MLKVSEKSDEIAEIPMSGRVTAPVPLKYDICCGSGQEELKRLPVATSLTTGRISNSTYEAHISYNNPRMISSLFLLGCQPSFWDFPPPHDVQLIAATDHDKASHSQRLR